MLLLYSCNQLHINTNMYVIIKCYFLLFEQLMNTFSPNHKDDV